MNTKKELKVRLRAHMLKHNCPPDCETLLNLLSRFARVAAKEAEDSGAESSNMPIKERV